MSTALLGEEHEAIRALVRDFGREQVRPRIAELEAAGEFPRELYRQMGELGFFGCVFPEEHGGTDIGFRALAVVAEELAYAYPPLSAGMNLQAATVPLTILRYGTPEQVKSYVPGLIAGELLGFNAMTEPDGGSDFLGAMRTRAERRGDGWVLNGAKMFITNANVADAGVVYAKTDPAAKHKGVTAFIVDTGTPGLSVQRVPCRVLGALMPTTSLAFEDCAVGADQVLGAEGEGFTVAMRAMDVGRLTVASRSLGLARACLDASVEYCNSREAFGQKIGPFQMIKERSRRWSPRSPPHARWSTRPPSASTRACPATREASIAKYYAGEACQRAAQSTAEIFGGYAFTDEYPIATYVAYAKLWQTGEGSANIQRILLADDALGWRRMDRHEQAAARA